ncbi:prephenate dehydratase [bacterium]|nr:prephenate dehydratase [bacterium]
MKKVSFQGEKGAYSEAAAVHYWHEKVLPVPQKTFKDVFISVHEASCDFGIIPIENSLTGSIHQNIDLLLEFELSVVGEIILRIHHHLMALKGVRLSQIRRVFSHPQALQQCSNFLENWSGVEAVPMYDTAGSAAYVLEHGLKDCAAIASLQASQDFGLNVLKKGVENNQQNYTRFLIISKTPDMPEKSGKTSIVFSTKDIPGALFKAISVFALRDINLLKIESRPLRSGPWKYWFYLDFEGRMNQEPCLNAIQHLGEITSFLKVLGSYPAGKIID